MATPPLVEFRAIVPVVIPLPDPAAAQQAVRLTQQGAHEVQAKAASYPPQLPTRYVRTGRLGRGWRVRNTMDGAIVENPVLYGIYVQGDWQTAEMIRRNWRTIEAINQEVWVGKYLPLIRAALEKGKPL